MGGFRANPRERKKKNTTNRKFERTKKINLERYEPNKKRQPPWPPSFYE